VILKPMLATLASQLPIGPPWTYEVKWDGYRALAVKEYNRVRLESRNQKDLTRDYPTIVSAILAAPQPKFILDGEIVALDKSGRPSFQALQHRKMSSTVCAFYAFDVLSVGDESVMGKPLKARRQTLRSLIAGTGILQSEPLPGAVDHIEHEIRRLGLEGAVAKRDDSVYKPGERSNEWIKVRFSPQQEFVIGGFKPSASNFESLVVGCYEQKRLQFAARVRSGFTPYAKAEVFRRIVDRQVDKCPFVDLPNSDGGGQWGEGVTEEDMTKLCWVKPTVVVQVEFVEWTDGGLLRHPKFVGLRDDKKASEVKRERL
jgi:DNA ligase D-like protein (predicted ligase)